MRFPGNEPQLGVVQGIVSQVILVDRTKTLWTEIGARIHARRSSGRPHLNEKRESRFQPSRQWTELFPLQTSLDGNETTSVLSLNASRQHNHKHLVCRVTNPEMDSAVMEDAWRIAVKCTVCSTACDSSVMLCRASRILVVAISATRCPTIG